MRSLDIHSTSDNIMRSDTLMYVRIVERHERQHTMANDGLESSL